MGVIEINNRQLAATLVDLRTAKGRHLTSEQNQAAKAALCGIYVGFAVQYAKFNRDEERKNTGDGSDDDSKESEGMAEDGSDGSFVENAAKKQKGEPTSALTSGFTYPAADNDDDDDLEGFGFPEEVVEEEGRPDEKSEEELDEEAKEAAEIEFPTVFKNWVQLKIDWRTKFPEVDFPAAPAPLDVLHQRPLGHQRCTGGQVGDGKHPAAAPRSSSPHLDQRCIHSLPNRMWHAAAAMINSLIFLKAGRVMSSV